MPMSSKLTVEADCYKFKKHICHFEGKCSSGANTKPGKGQIQTSEKGCSTNGEYIYCFIIISIGLWTDFIKAWLIHNLQITTLKSVFFC